MKEDYVALAFSKCMDWTLPCYSRKGNVLMVPIRFIQNVIFPNLELNTLEITLSERMETHTLMSKEVRSLNYWLKSYSSDGSHDQNEKVTNGRTHHKYPVLHEGDKGCPIEEAKKFFESCFLNVDKQLKVTSTTKTTSKEQSSTLSLPPQEAPPSQEGRFKFKNTFSVKVTDLTKRTDSNSTKSSRWDQKPDDLLLTSAGKAPVTSIDQLIAKQRQIATEHQQQTVLEDYSSSEAEHRSRTRITRKDSESVADSPSRATVSSPTTSEASGKRGSRSKLRSTNRESSSSASSSSNASASDLNKVFRRKLRHKRHSVQRKRREINNPKSYQSSSSSEASDNASETSLRFARRRTVTLVKPLRRSPNKSACSSTSFDSNTDTNSDISEPAVAGNGAFSKRPQIPHSPTRQSTPTSEEPKSPRFSGVQQRIVRRLIGLDMASSTDESQSDADTSPSTEFETNSSVKNSDTVHDDTRSTQPTQVISSLQPAMLPSTSGEQLNGFTAMNPANYGQSNPYQFNMMKLPVLLAPWPLIYTGMNQQQPYALPQCQVVPSDHLSTAPTLLTQSLPDNSLCTVPSNSQPALLNTAAKAESILQRQQTLNDTNAGSNRNNSKLDNSDTDSKQPQGENRRGLLKVNANNNNTSARSAAQISLRKSQQFVPSDDAPLYKRPERKTPKRNAAQQQQQAAGSKEICLKSNLLPAHNGGGSALAAPKAILSASLGSSIAQYSRSACTDANHKQEKASDRRSSLDSAAYSCSNAGAGDMLTTGADAQVADAQKARNRISESFILQSLAKPKSSRQRLVEIVDKLAQESAEFNEVLSDWNIPDYAERELSVEATRRFDESRTLRMSEYHRNYQHHHHRPQRNNEYDRKSHGYRSSPSQERSTKGSSAEKRQVRLAEKASSPIERKLATFVKSSSLSELIISIRQSVQVKEMSSDSSSELWNSDLEDISDTSLSCSDWELSPLRNTPVDCMNDDLIGSTAESCMWPFEDEAADWDFDVFGSLLELEQKSAKKADDFQAAQPMEIDSQPSTSTKLKQMDVLVSSGATRKTGPTPVVSREASVVDSKANKSASVSQTLSAFSSHLAPKAHKVTVTKSVLQKKVNTPATKPQGTAANPKPAQTSKVSRVSLPKGESTKTVAKPDKGSSGAIVSNENHRKPATGLLAKAKPISQAPKLPLAKVTVAPKIDGSKSSAKVPTTSTKVHGIAGKSVPEVQKATSKSTESSDVRSISRTTVKAPASSTADADATSPPENKPQNIFDKPPTVITSLGQDSIPFLEVLSSKNRIPDDNDAQSNVEDLNKVGRSSAGEASNSIRDSVEKVPVSTSTEAETLGQLSSMAKTASVSASTASKMLEQSTSLSESASVSSSSVSKNLDISTLMSERASVPTSTSSKQLPTPESNIHSIQDNIENVKFAICSAVQKRMQSADLSNNRSLKARKSTVAVLTSPTTAEPLSTAEPKSKEFASEVVQPEPTESFAAVEEVSSSCTENSIKTTEKPLEPSFNDTRMTNHDLSNVESESMDVGPASLINGAQTILPNVSPMDNTTSLPMSDVTLKQMSTNMQVDSVVYKTTENPEAQRETTQTNIMTLNGNKNECSLERDNNSVERGKVSTETEIEPLVTICPADSTKIIQDPELEQAQDNISKEPWKTSDNFDNEEDPDLWKKENQEQSIDLEPKLSDVNNNLCDVYEPLSSFKAGNLSSTSNADCDLREMQTDIPAVVTKQSWKKKLLEKAIVQSSDMVAVREINRIRSQLSLNKLKEQSENTDSNLSKLQGPVHSPTTVLSSDFKSASVKEGHDFPFDSVVKTVEVQSSQAESSEMQSPENLQSQETIGIEPVDCAHLRKTSIEEDQNLDICISDATVEVSNSLEVESEVACCIEVQSESLETVETESKVDESLTKPPPQDNQPVIHKEINSANITAEAKTIESKSKGIKRKYTVIKKSTKGQRRPSPAVQTGSAKRAKRPKPSPASNPPSKADCELSSDLKGSFPRLVLTRSNMQDFHKGPKPAETIPTEQPRNQSMQNLRVSITKASAAEIAGSMSFTSPSSPSSIVSRPSSITSTTSTRSQRPKVIVPTPKSPLSSAPKDSEIPVTSATAVVSSSEKRQKISKSRQAYSSAKDAKAFVDDAPSDKISLSSNQRPDVTSSDPYEFDDNTTATSHKAHEKKDLIETKQLSIVLSDLKTARNCKQEKMYRAATRRKPLPSISSEDEDDTPATDGFLDQASLIEPTTEEDEDDEVVFVSVLSNKNWKETVLGVERSSSNENKDANEGDEATKTICDKPQKSEDIKPEVENKQPSNVVDKSPTKTTDEDSQNFSNKDEVKELNEVSVKLNEATTEVEMPLPEPRTSCIEATFQSRIDDDSSKCNGPTEQPLPTNNAELPMLQAAKVDQKVISESCNATSQPNDSSKNKHDLSVAKLKSLLSTPETPSTTSSPIDMSIEKHDLPVAESKSILSTSETASTTSQSSLSTAEKSLNPAKSLVKSSTSSPDLRLQSLNPHGNCYHGIVEVELHAPRKFLKGGKWNQTKKEMFRKRRIAYSQVKLQRNPESLNNCASKSSNLPRQLDVSLLRIRDVAFLLACDAKAFVTYLMSQRIRMFRPDPFTRQAYENIYDPVSRDNPYIKSRMGLNEKIPDPEATENQMIYMEDLLRLILPQYFKTHFNIESKQLPQFVSVKTYQPINYINQDVIKMFAESFAFNQFLFNCDVELRTEPPKQRRKRKSKDSTPVGSDAKQAKGSKAPEEPNPPTSSKQDAIPPAKNVLSEAEEIPSSSSLPGAPIADTGHTHLNGEIQLGLSNRLNQVGASLNITSAQSGRLNQSFSPPGAPIANTAIANPATPNSSQLLQYLTGSNANPNLQRANFSATPQHQVATANQFAPRPFVTLNPRQEGAPKSQLAGFPPYHAQQRYPAFHPAEMLNPRLPYTPYHQQLPFAANPQLPRGQATVQHPSAHQAAFDTAQQEQFRLATMGVYPPQALQHLRRRSDSPFSAGSRRSSTESLSLGAKFVHGNAPTPPAQAVNNERDVEMRMNALLFSIQQDEQLQEIEAAPVGQQQQRFLQSSGIAIRNLLPIQPEQMNLFRPHEYPFAGKPIHMNLNGNNNTTLGPNAARNQLVGGGLIPRSASVPAFVASRDPVTSDVPVSTAVSPRAFRPSPASDTDSAPENEVLAISSVFSLNETGLKTTSEFLTKTGEEKAGADSDQDVAQDSNSVCAKIEGLVRLLRPDDDLVTEAESAADFAKGKRKGGKRRRRTAKQKNELSSVVQRLAGRVKGVKTY